MPLTRALQQLQAGEYLQAKRETERLLNIGELAPVDTALAYRVMAVASYQLMEIYAAVKLGEKALAVAEALESWELIGKLRRDLGSYYLTLGDTHMAEKMFNLFLVDIALYPDLAPLQAEIHYNQHVICRQRRDSKGALIALRTAAELFDRYGDQSHYMLCVRHIGMCHLLEADPDAAHPHIQTVAAYLQRQDDPQLAAHHLTDLARYWRLKGDLQASAEFCEEAMMPGRPGVDDHVFAEAALIMSENAIDRSRMDEARIFANLAVEAAVKAKHPLMMNRACALRRQLQELSTPA